MSDVLEGLGVGIDERVEEPKRGLALREQDGVQACEDGRNDRARRRGACDARPAANVDAVWVLGAAERSDVGVAAARVVVQRCVGQQARRGQVLFVRGDGVLLVRGDGEGVGEAAASRAPCCLLTDRGAVKVGAADRGVVG